MGFAAGFQVGAQAVERGLKMREEDKLKRELAAAYAKPETSQGYTAETGQQLEALANSGAYDIVPQYAPAAEGQTQGVFTGYQAVPKAGLDLQGDMPAAPMSFNPQQVQDYGGRRVAGQFDPTQLQGLQMREAARAVGASGDPVRAAQMMAEATRIEREAIEAPLRLEALRTQVEAGKLGLTKTQQDIETGTLTLAEKKRLAAEQQRSSDFAAFAAERPDATVAELKDAAFKQFKFTPDQWQKTVTTRLGIENAEMDSFKNGIKKKLQGKNLQQLGSLYNSDPDFDDKTDLAIVPGKNGAVTLNFIDKATKRITGTQTFKNESLATEYLNKQATEPENIGSWMLALRKTESAIESQGAATEASRATVGLRNAQMKQISNQEAASAEAQQIRAQFMALSDDDQAGPKGLALRQAFTMANAKAGAVVPLGSPPRAERPEVPASAVVDYAKGLIGKPSGEMKDGKPVKYTAETAAAAARRALSAQGGAAADPADALIEAMRKNAPAQRQATPAGQSLVNLSNIMLPPAAPVVTAPTTSQERLRGLYLQPVKPQ
jgi:hypothetical protein